MDIEDSWEHCLDYPDKFVVRRFEIIRGRYQATDDIQTADTPAIVTAPNDFGCNYFIPR